MEFFNMANLKITGQVDKMCLKDTSKIYHFLKQEADIELYKPGKILFDKSNAPKLAHYYFYKFSTFLILLKCSSRQYRQWHISQQCRD